MGKNQNRKHHGVLRVLTALVLAGILAYGGIVAMICVEEGKVPKTLASGSNYDAIIVLGAQVKPDRTLSVQLSWRMDAAIEAYKKKNVPIVVCGAQGPDEPCTEAEAMREYLLKEGIPENSILSDPESFNTNENLENAKELLKEFPDIRRVLIVTSDYHVPRSLAIAQDVGFEAEGLGAKCLPERWIKNHAREALAWCKYWAKKYLRLPL
jgi:uncharacterized SAM-binding protein YcdF (DUF218 family)